MTTDPAWTNCRTFRLSATSCPAYETMPGTRIGAPKSTPTEYIDKLNKEIGAALTNAILCCESCRPGGTPFYRSPAEFGRFIADETGKWAKVMKSASIKPE